MNAKVKSAVKTSIQVILLVLVIVYPLTGYGITENRIMRNITFGLLTPPVAFEIHQNLIIPFIIFLLLHIFFKPISRLFSKGRNDVV